MKRISLLIGTSLILLASTAMAGTTLSSTTDSKTTSLDSNWTCTTNASSSSVEADTAADKQMSETAKSATDAFAFASTNCRDCTKITCEVSK